MRTRILWTTAFVTPLVVELWHCLSMYPARLRVGCCPTHEEEAVRAVDPSHTERSLPKVPSSHFSQIARAVQAAKLEDVVCHAL